MTSRGSADSLAMPTLDMETRELSELAVRGLGPMFDPQSQLYCFRLNREGSAMVREGVSHRYTIMVLLGFHQREQAGLTSPVDVKSIFLKMLRESSWLTSLGDLGLLLWLCAVASPEHMKELWDRFDVSTSLSRYREASEGRTMELSWLLTGLAHASLASLSDQCAGLDDLAGKCYSLLRDNQGDHGYFGHLARKGTLAGALRGHIGSFADQVYPILAFTKFSEAYEDTGALDRALACAEGICRVQGEQGQWWWHYDSKTGRVAERYPVYSVHQHAMAPMALLAIAKTHPEKAIPAIYKGLQWISGTNELGCDLRDTSHNLVWRCLYPKGYRRYVAIGAGAVGLRTDFQSRHSMAIRFECRPYELGWLLYAFPGVEVAVPATRLG